MMGVNERNENYTNEVYRAIATRFMHDHLEFAKNPARLAEIIGREPWEVSTALAPLIADINREVGFDVTQITTPLEC